MKYYKRYKEPNAKETEIIKAKARELLTGYWKEKVLDEIFCYEYSFHLYTPYTEIWTIDETGKNSMTEPYGIYM